MKIVENQYLCRNKDDFEKNLIKKFVYFYSENFIFYKNTCKMYILTDI